MNINNQGSVKFLIVIFSILVVSNEVRSESYTFDGGGSPGNPAAPAPFAPIDWDIQVHVRSASDRGAQLQTQQGDHGPLCEAPGHDGSVTHTINNKADAVYQCANHIMTSFKADDYGLIALTPPALVDFSQQAATVEVDISSLSDSLRDWFGIVIQPPEESLPLPIFHFLPDLNGMPRNAIHFDFQQGHVCPYVVRDLVDAEGSDIYAGSCQWWENWEEYFTPSAQTRQTLKLTISANQIRVEAPEIDLVWDDMSIPDLTWNQGLVTLLHHSYTPGKNGSDNGNTWHWDNLVISPSVPIQIESLSPREIQQDNTLVSLNSPAPENSFLRGSAISARLEVSFDQGQSWQQTKQQASQNTGGTTWQFWHPVPEGTSAFLVRAGERFPDWWSGSWIAKDMSLFSLTSNGTDLNPDPVLQSCRELNTVQQWVDGEWISLQQSESTYQAEDCLNR